MTGHGSLSDSPQGAGGTSQRDSVDILRDAIRSHVAAHMVSAERLRSGEVAGIATDAVLEALLVPNPAFLDSIVPTLITHDVTLDIFYRAVMVPVTERIGDMWCSDEIDFVTVEIISMRLRMLLNRLVAHHNRMAAGREADPRRSVILADAHNSGHNLGLAMVEAFFRDAGWQVDGGAHVLVDELFLENLGRRDYTIVALGMSSASSRNDDATIRRCRDLSANRDVQVCVGGKAVQSDPQRYRDWGADIVALDPPEALRLAEAAIA